MSTGLPKSKERGDKSTSNQMTRSLFGLKKKLEHKENINLHHRKFYEDKMLKQGVATEQMSTPTEAVETLTIQEKDMMGKIKQHLITAQDDGLQAPPVPSRSSRRITPHISQRLGNEIGDAHSKRRYYMRKGLFSNIGGNPKKKSIVKTERVSQNSHNVSGKQVKNNGSYSFRPIKGCTSQDGSIGAAIRGPHSFTGRPISHSGLYAIQADPLSGKITLSTMQLLKAKSNDKKPSSRKPGCLGLDSLPKPKALSRRPASERKHRKKKLRNSSENIRKQPEKGSLSTQSHVLLRVSNRKRKGLTFEDGPGHNSTEEDIKDQKTLKKSLLRNFLEGTRRDIKGKHLKQLQEFRKLNKNSEDFSKKPEFQLSKKSIDSSQRESKTNTIKFNAEAVKVYEQKKERLDKADLSNLLFSDFPDNKEKELSVFRACDLFDKLHEETANPELKKVKNNIELFYKTSSPNKVPPTDLSNYKLIKLIGKGSFGKVYLGLQLLTSRLVAIKCLEKNNIRDPGVRSKILQEIDVLKAANQVPQITQLLEVFENTNYVFLIIVYAKGGDLLRYIKSKTRLAEDEAKNVFLKTLMGVCGLHARGILHRDIKLDNILLDEKQDPTICDFGVSRKMKDREVINEQCGTPAYIAPEIIQEAGYSGLKADVWSMGVMLYAMLIGKMPFKGSTISDLHVSITTAGFKFPQEPKISFEAKDLISKMMVVDPSQRLSSFEVLRHKWIGLDSSEADVILQKTSDNRVFIEENLLNQVTKYGFSIDGVRESLLSKKLNHATACYYNLQHCLGSG